MTADELPSGLWVVREKPKAKTADEHFCDLFDVKLTVTLLDTVTGRTAVDGRGSTYDWTEGNWSCDCNRMDAFGDDYGEEGVCQGEKRYIVVKAEPLLEGYTLAEFNDGYPKELTDRHRCPACYSDRVWVGNFVLSCETCGWNYLNKYPCDVCGKPSFNASGLGGKSRYGCKEHPTSLLAS